MTKKHCVYLHISPSKKVYVGQTCNVKKRWGTNGEHYKSKKKDGSYVQRLFARAILKYGWKNFEHKIILDGISKKHADYAEKYLIRWYKIHHMSYNITNGGEGVMCKRPPLPSEARRRISERLLAYHPMRGKHLSPEVLARVTAANRNKVYTPEQRAEMSERNRKLRLGKKASDTTRKKLSAYRKAHPESWVAGWNKKEVHQYDLEGNYMASYKSAIEAATAICKNIPSDINNCCKGKVLSAGGYFWRYDKISKIDMSGYKVVKTPKGCRIFDISEAGRLKRSSAHGSPVNQYSLDGKYIKTYCTVSEASRQTGVCNSTINKCCRHLPRHKTAGGYLWEFDNGNNQKDQNIA